MALAKKIVYNAAATGINVASGLLRNKIFAAFLSLNLFGVLSLGQQSVSLVVTVFAFGLPLGITTLVSQMLSKPVEEQVRTTSRVIGLATIVAGILTLILVCIVLIRPDLLSRAVTGSDEYELAIALLLFSSPLMLIETCLYAVMEGMGKVNAIIRFKMIPAIVSLPILYFITAEFHLVGAAAGIVVNEALLVILGLFLLRKDISLSAGFTDLKPVLVNVYKVAALSFGVGALWFVLDFFVKRYVFTTLGEVENGIVQSVAKIADLYPTIALSWLSMHLFPVISLSAGDKRASANALQRTVLVAVVLIVPIIIILFALRSEVLQIVYKKEFTVAVDYFGAMLTIGIAKVFAWVIGLALLPLGMKRQWFYSAVLMTVLYMCGVWIGIAAGLSIYAIPVANGFGLIAQIIYTLIVYKKKGFVFNTSFGIQAIMYAVFTAIFVAAVVYPLMLLAAAVLFGWMLFHYDILAELKARFDAYRAKITS